jgi:hypothetical protein
VLTCVVLIGSGCSDGSSLTAKSTSENERSTSTSRAFATSTTTTSDPTSLRSFSVEPCADIVRSPLLRSDTDQQPLLLSAAQLPVGASIDGPHQTSTTESTMVASVPSTSPAAYETVTLSQDTSPGGTVTLTLDEVIGDVGSVNFARQFLSALDADLNGPNCNPNGADTVSLPGSNPPTTATLSAGQGSNGSIRSERLFAAKGSRLLCLTWTSQLVVSPSGLNPEPTVPPLPDGSAMAQTLDTALALIPS